MTGYHWLLVHILPSVGFILALIIFSRILREKRPPSSTLAWLMAIIFIPYLGVPLYLIFGGRKMLSRAAAKPKFEQRLQKPLDSDIATACLVETGSGVFPPSAHNRITFLPRGEQAFQTILHLIQSARRSIYIATFILGKDDTGRAIVGALAEKASQGLEVRLLFDALGSVNISRKFLAPLLTAGGQATDFMPMVHLPFRGRANLRNHRKMIVCDNQAAVIGGMNLALEYMGPRDVDGRWRDLSLLVEGPVVGHITDVFRSDWSFASKTPLPTRPNTTQEAACADAKGRTQLIASGPDVPDDSLRDAILTEVFRAKRRIWVVTPYFVPDELLLEALCIAASHGVDVSIIAPKKSNHLLADIVREGYLTRIQEAGASVWLYKPRMLHAKALIIDDTLAMVGSANMDMRSILLNYEIAMCLYDVDDIGQLESWMRDVVGQCSRRKPRPARRFGFVEGVGRLFAPLL